MPLKAIDGILEALDQEVLGLKGFNNSKSGYLGAHPSKHTNGELARKALPRERDNNSPIIVDNNNQSNKRHHGLFCRRTTCQPLGKSYKTDGGQLHPQQPTIVF